MKTPLRSLNNRSGAFSAVFNSLPDEYDTIHFPFFVNGGLELRMCMEDRNIVGHTHHWCVYEFWDCLKQDPQRLIQNIKFTLEYEHLEERFYYHMQENFQKNPDVFVRSAQFYALNRCNAEGQIFGGKWIGLKHVNDLNYYNMKNLDLLNLEPKMHDDILPINIIDAIPDDEYIIATPPKFSYRLLPDAQADTVINPNIDHWELKEKMADRKKWISVCSYHKKLHDIYKEFEIKYFSRNWTETTQEKAEEMLIVKS